MRVKWLESGKRKSKRGLELSIEDNSVARSTASSIVSSVVSRIFRRSTSFRSSFKKETAFSERDLLKSSTKTGVSTTLNLSENDEIIDGSVGSFCGGGDDDDGSVSLLSMGDPEHVKFRDRYGNIRKDFVKGFRPTDSNENGDSHNLPPRVISFRNRERNTLEKTRVEL